MDLDFFVDAQADEETLRAFFMSCSEPTSSSSSSSASRKDYNLHHLFNVAVATENIPMLNSLASRERSSRYGEILPSLQRSVDETLTDLVQEGVRATLIDIMQEKLASSRTVTLLQREHVNLRKKHGASQCIPHYLVSIAEKDKIKELKARLHLAHGDLNEDRVWVNSKKAISTRIKNKMFLNDTFEDAVRFNNKLVVSFLLSNVSGVSKPSVILLDKAFALTLKKGNISMATILRNHVSQDAYDMAFSDLSEMMLDSMDSNGYSSRHQQQSLQQDGEWSDVITYILTFLLDGQAGFTINSDFIESTYTIIMEKHISCLRGGKVSTAKPTFVPVLESMVSDVVKQRIRHQMARSRHEEVFLRNQNSGIMDIHDYSATSVVNNNYRDISGSSSSSSSASGNGGVNNEAMESSSSQSQSQSIPIATPIGEIPQQTRMTSLRGRQTTLNASILDTIDRRVREFDKNRSGIIGASYSQEQVSEILSEILTSADDFSPSQQETAITYMESFLNNESAAIIGQCLRFLETLENPNVLPLWLKGFIGESIQMNSCRQGAIERCVTGLRGISDHELDDLFKQAEGPHLARIFLMSAFNIFNATVPIIDANHNDNNITNIQDNIQEKRNNTNVASCTDEAVRATARAQNLAEELVKRSIRPNTRLEQVEIILKNFAKESLTGFMVDPDSSEFREQIDAVVSTVVDSYDDILKYFIEECIHNREHRNVCHVNCQNTK